MPIPNKKLVVFLVSFYFPPCVVARLSKCEITLCISNTHVLKLFSFDQIFNSETYRPCPLCIWFDLARLFMHELCVDTVSSQGQG